MEPPPSSSILAVASRLSPRQQQGPSPTCRIQLFAVSHPALLLLLSCFGPGLGLARRLSAAALHDPWAGGVDDNICSQLVQHLCLLGPPRHSNDLGSQDLQVVTKWSEAAG